MPFWNRSLFGSKRHARQPGWTLIEMSMSMVIVGALAVVSIPPACNAWYARAAATDVASFKQSVIAAYQAYVTEFGPPVGKRTLDAFKYLDNVEKTEVPAARAADECPTIFASVASANPQTPVNKITNGKASVLLPTNWDSNTAAACFVDAGMNVSETGRFAKLDTNYVTISSSTTGTNNNVPVALGQPVQPQAVSVATTPALPPADTSQTGGTPPFTPVTTDVNPQSTPAGTTPTAPVETPMAAIMNVPAVASVVNMVPVISPSEVPTVGCNMGGPSSTNNTTNGMTAGNGNGMTTGNGNDMTAGNGNNMNMGQISNGSTANLNFSFHDAQMHFLEGVDVLVVVVGGNSYHGITGANGMVNIANVPSGVPCTLIFNKPGYIGFMMPVSNLPEGTSNLSYAIAEEIVPAGENYVGIFANWSQEIVDANPNLFGYSYTEDSYFQVMENKMSLLFNNQTLAGQTATVVGYSLPGQLTVVSSTGAMNMTSIDQFARDAIVDVNGTPAMLIDELNNFAASQGETINVAGDPIVLQSWMARYRAVNNTRTITYRGSTVNMEDYCPVKVNLAGRDAQINSDDRFMFALSGFTGKLPWIKTAGGLNMDEAWLMADRERNELFYNTVMDGNDVFGDHAGKFKSGYEDLAELFKADLKTDDHGKKYIPLKQMNWFERFWIWLTRFFGQNTDWNPSYDLKLVTRNHNVYYASDMLAKIYVDYKTVNETDKSKQNWIRQRADVVFHNGIRAQSADQWFQSVMVLSPRKK